ncbi:MAG: hypothetical protein JRF25_00260 [Deltaproteobacteria bacterium]|nr:hypothetical protein [Deltaproteobacteria bacterium]
MKRREWVYVMSPSAYEMSCDLCNGEVEWSEFQGLVWCWRCLKDTRGNPGVFGGPIGIEACRLLGISFDRIHLKTGKRIKYNFHKTDLNTGESIKYNLKGVE